MTFFHLVTIVITYVDEVEFLKDALHSAMQQVSEPKEIIIVCNDRIQDNPRLLPENEQYPALWIHEPVTGSAYARNAGLNRATGDWIQFLDVDDILMPGKIAHQLEYGKNAGAVVSPHRYQYLNGSSVESKWISTDIWTGLLNSGLGSTSSMLWKRQALVDAGGWSTQYQSHQEYELLFRLASSGHNITCADRTETIVRQRRHGSITQKSKPVRAIEGIRLRELIWKYIKEHSLETPGRKMAFLQYIFRQLRGLMRTDAEVAKKLHAQYFDKSFTPSNTGLPFYAAFYRILGFTKTEQVFKLYNGLRDKYLSFLPKNI